MILDKVFRFRIIILFFKFIKLLKKQINTKVSLEKQGSQTFIFPYPTEKQKSGSINFNIRIKDNQKANIIFYIWEFTYFTASNLLFSSFA